MSEVIEAVGPVKVIALTSDHAPNMTSAIRLLQAKYPWIVFSGCKAHALDLACRDILKIPAIQSILDSCKEITSFFSQVLCAF